jgi:hypothetical protein
MNETEERLQYLKTAQNGRFFDERLMSINTTLYPPPLMFEVEVWVLGNDP